MQILCPSSIRTSISEGDISSQYNSDSDNVNIRPTKSQKTLVIDFDTESEDTLTVLESASLLL